MASDRLRLVGRALVFFLPFFGTLFFQRIQAIYHRFTYKATPDAKNVVVLGGSFAGIALAKRLAETLPTGFKAVLIEKHSHFNYTFNFPRFSVLRGREGAVFIPYTGVVSGAPAGVFKRVQATVTDLSKTHVLLDSGDSVSYEYLAIATGSSQPLPVQVSANERHDACLELQSVQQNISDSRTVAVVGAGAVGVELATDIKDFYPDKEVTLIHSRAQLLNNFGKRLHDYVLPALEAMQIRVLLNERPQLPPDASMSRDTTLTFADGHTEAFDLVMGCTGQRPNSDILASLLPDSISSKTSRILVMPTLQVQAMGEPSPHIFAFGDVAEHGGPRMARAGFFQAQIVCENILAMIRNRPPTKTYVPRLDFEGAIKLTLGKSHQVIYAMDGDASELLVPGHGGKVDLGIAKVWKQYGADFQQAENPVFETSKD